MSRAKHWFLTINNPTWEDGQAFTEDGGTTMAPHLAYLMLGSHKGEKKKTPHIHAVIALKKQLRFNAVKKLYPRANISKRKGTVEECAVYLDKEGTMQEWGTRPASLSQRNKRNWDQAFQLAKEGKLDEIPSDMLIRYYHAFKRIRQDNPPKYEDLDSHQNYWVVGDTGNGKSRYARKRWPDYFDKAPNKWFIGYKGQTTVLIDDLQPEHCVYLSWYIKRWADLYAYPYESKGGGGNMRPKHIVITSQYTISECFPDLKKCNAISRRFKEIHLIHWKKRINFSPI